MLERSQCRYETQTVQTESSSRESKRCARTRKFDPSRTFIYSQKNFKLKKLRLQWADCTSLRQYVISGPPTIVYHSHQSSNTGVPSVVWQQQMEKFYIQTHNSMHMIHKTLPTYKQDYTDNFDIQFRPLPEVIAYDTSFGDPKYGLDPHWDEDLFNQDKLEYKDTYKKLNDQFEGDDLITAAHVSETLRNALLDLWTVNLH